MKEVLLKMTNRRIYQQNHATYSCQYHIVWTTRYRGNTLSDKYIKQEFKRIFKQICKWKGFPIHAWHIGDEHIHLYITIPPKYSASYTINILKGKSSAWIKKKTKQFPVGSLWARGYFCTTLGINEMVVKKYIENQKRYQVDQPKLF